MALAWIHGDRAGGGGIIAHWPFDADASDVTGDHDGSLFGDAFISADGDAPAGQALVLDGDGDYATTDEHSPDFELQAGTISLWYQGAPPGQQNSLYDLLDLHHGVAHGPAHSWVVQGSTQLPGGSIGWLFSQGGGAGTEGNSLLDGQWHHLVSVFAAGSPDPAKLYIDGVLVNESSQPPIVTYAEIAPLVFGRWGAAADEGFPPDVRDFKGRIDDVQIYDLPLAEGQVQFLFDNPGEEVDPCPADANDDGVVDVNDLLAVLGAWGTDGPGADIAEPFDVADVNDLLAVLADWGPCP